MAAVQIHLEMENDESTVHTSVPIVWKRLPLLSRTAYLICDSLCFQILWPIAHEVQSFFLLMVRPQNCHTNPLPKNHLR